MNSLAAQRDDRLLLDEIERAPVRFAGAPSTNKCAQALSAMICAAPALTKSAKRESGISIAGCSVLDRIENLLHAVGRRPRRQVRSHAKREFRLGDAHFVSGHRGRAAIRNDGFGQNAPGHRAIDIDVLLPGLAGGRDFPAEQRSSRVVFDLRLDGVTLGAVARPPRRFETSELGAGAPVIVQGPGRRRYLILVEHRFAIPSWRSSDDNPGVRPEPPQQPQHRRFRHRYAAGGRPEILARQMQEYRAAAAPDTRRAVVIDLDDEIIEMVVAPEPVAAAAAIQPDRLVVVAA